MSLGVFDRLTYITDYNLSLCNQVVPQFNEQVEHLNKLLENSDIRICKKAGRVKFIVKVYLYRVLCYSAK